MTSELMKNKCGSCTLCCKLLAVEELSKPTDKWCKWCNPSQGCRIYEDRPRSCINFECGYLLSNLPIEFRPNNLHLIITGESNKINAVILHGDPKYPNAINSKNGQRLIQIFAKNDKSILLVLGDKRKIISNNPKDAQKVNEILKEMDKDTTGKIKINIGG